MKIVGITASIPVESYVIALAGLLSLLALGSLLSLGDYIETF